MSYKLLVETPASKEDFEYVLEESGKDGKKNMYRFLVAHTFNE